MDDVFRRVEAFAGREGMFRRTRSVLAAVSGGADSVALLLVLERLSSSSGFEVTVCHFDHKLRPESSDDLAWVRTLCEARGVTFLSGEGDVRDVAARQRLGIEEAARRMRYQFLSFVAGQKGIDVIATGHTADDQAETVLMRVLRGRGVRGIRGMRPVATVPGGSQKLVRPLLELTRGETEAVCAAAGITPLNDSSNADETPTRNRLRHIVLPVLEELNPAVREALNRLAGNAAEVFERVEKEAMTAQPSVRGPVGAIFGLQQARSLGSEALGLVIEREAAFYRLEVETNATRLRNAAQVLGSGSGAVRFGDVEVEASCGVVRIGPRLEPAELEAKVLNVPGATMAPPWRVDISTAPLPRIEGSEQCAISTAGQRGALRVRSLAAGDRILYHGMERKVMDVFAAAKVPRWERTGAVAIADSHSVRAVLTAAGAFEADGVSEEDALYVRLSQAPSRG